MSATVLRAQRLARRLVEALTEDTDAEVEASLITARRLVSRAVRTLAPPPAEPDARDGPEAPRAPRA